MLALSPGSAALASLPALLDRVTSGLIVFDRDYRIAACNAAALQQLDQPLAAVLGRRLDEVVSAVVGIDSGAAEDDDGSAMSLGGVPAQAENSITQPPACRGSGSWSAHVVLDDAGVPDGGVCLHHPDLVPRDRAERQHEVERLRDFVESASDWFWETDAELRYIYFSERYREATGVTAESRLGRKRGAFRLDGYDDGDWRAHLADLENRRPFRDFTFAYLDVDGKRRVARVSGRPVFDAGGTFLGYRGVGRDITAEVAAEEKIRFLAQHDALTGLANRVLLKDRLEQLLLRANRCDEGVAVLCVDLDDFKAVNDTLGHAAGDALLCAAAGRMREATRQMDTVARLGGDEFTVIQVNTHRFEDAEALATRLITSLSQPFDINGERLHCTASVGISIFPNDGTSADDLMRHAGLALDKAKSSGRDTYRFFTAEMDREVQDRRSLEKELRDALSKGSFCLHYQPQVDIATGRATGCEALLRWLHPDRGVIAPGTFIQVAERSGLITAIDRWVVREACRQATAWRNAGLLTGRVAVNLSAVQLRRTDVVDYIVSVLGECGLSPEDLEIEITESALLIDNETVTATLGAINDLGIHLAVDDFGTGYSSLTYLKRFPVRKVKIDRSFVHNLMFSEDDRAIARAIVTLGHSLGLQVVAEGVEKPEQLACLRALGCDEVQGYLISRPLPAADFAAWLARCTRKIGGVDGARQTPPSKMPPDLVRHWLGHMII